MGRVRNRQRGQGLVEFAIIFPVLLLMFGVVVNGAFALETSNSLANSTRIAARYATINPTAWSNAASPPDNTIQGQLMQNKGIVSNLTTQQISISYFDMSVAPAVECGYYDPQDGEYTVPADYTGPENTQATCVVANNEVRVGVNTTYNLLTGPLDSGFPGSLPISGSTTMLIEVTPTS